MDESADPLAWTFMQLVVTLDAVGVTLRREPDPADPAGAGVLRLSDALGELETGMDAAVRRYAPALLDLAAARARLAELRAPRA